MRSKKLASKTVAIKEEAMATVAMVTAPVMMAMATAATSTHANPDLAIRSRLQTTTCSVRSQHPAVAPVMAPTTPANLFPLKTGKT